MQNDYFADDVLDVLKQMERIQGDFAEQAANSRGEAKLTDIEGVNGVSHVRASYERAYAYADAATRMLSAVGHLKSVLAYREGTEDERGEQAEKNAANRDGALTGILNTLKHEHGAEWEEGQVLVSTGESGPFIGHYAGFERVATVMVTRDGKTVPIRAPFENLREATEEEKATIDPYHPLNLEPAIDAATAANPPVPLKRGPRFGVDFGHLSSEAERESVAIVEQAAPDTKATYSGHGPEPVRIEPIPEPTVPAVERFDPPLHGERISATTDGHRPLAVEGEYVGTNGDGDPVLRTDNGLEWVVQRGTIRPVPGSGHRRAE